MISDQVIKSNNQHVKTITLYISNQVQYKEFRSYIQSQLGRS